MIISKRDKCEKKEREIIKYVYTSSWTFAERGRGRKEVSERLERERM